MAARVERPPTAADRSRPPTPSTAVTPTSSASRRQVTSWAPVPDAATIPTGPGRSALAKPSPRPPTTAVPQSGPITSTSWLAASSLRTISCSTDTLSEKSITETPACTASMASTKAFLPGTEIKASEPPRLRALASVLGAGAEPKP